MRLKLALMSVVLAVAVAGCSSNIHMAYSPSEQKIILNPYPGDVILWAESYDHPLTTIDFPLGSPCESDADLAKGKCKVMQPRPNGFRIGPYTCDKCLDPEIVVGSDTSPILVRRAMMAGTTGLVQMGCFKGTQVKIVPTSVAFPVATVKGGTATVQWMPAGKPQIGDDWTTNDLSAICAPGPTFHAGSDTCTLLPDTKADTYNFTVSSASCNGTSANGTITIVP